MRFLRYLVTLMVLIAACSSGSPAPAPSVAVDLVIAATTDVHGRLRAWDYYSNTPDSAHSLASAATVVDSVRAANPGRVILVDAGDLLQGNPLDYVAARLRPNEPHPVIAAMNAMAYDASAIGNHEFNYGLATLDRAIGEARFPFLAANAFTPDGKRAYRSSVMVERAGVRVAIVGATTPGSMLWDRDNLRGHLVIRDIVPEVRAAVGEARRAGAEVVVVTVHSGLNEPASYDTVSTGVASENVAARLAREIPGIDVVVYGHSHKEMADTTIGSTLLMQPKNWAASVGVAHLQLVRQGGHWRVASKHSALVRSVRHREDSMVVAATEAMHRATIAYVTTAIGSTPVAWRADSARVSDTPLIDFVLEVERAATGAQLASTAAFSLDASIDPGPITVSRIAALYPYDNTLREIRISGRQLKEYLEQSAKYYKSYSSGAPVVNDSVPGFNFDIVAGVDYTLDISRPVGSRVTRLEFAGRPVAPDDSFTFALNNYRQTGGGGYAMLAGAPLIDDRQLEIRQLLIDEVRKRGVLEPADFFRKNWSLEPPAAATQAYAEMNRGEYGSRRAASRTTQSVSPAAAPLSRITGPRLRIITTNDFHGALEPRPDNGGAMRGGAAWVASAIDKARSECAAPECESVLVDAGDLFQGTPASNLSYGRSVVGVFNQLGYAATALGNHDFDWGRDTLRALMRAAHFPILGANVRDVAGRDIPWIPNDTIVQRGAYRVGIVGVSDIETPRTTKATNVTGLVFADPAPIIDSTANALRARGADVVIVLAHEGAFCSRDGTSSCAGEIVDLARRLTSKVDAIVSGHTHSVVNTEVNGIPIVQASSRGQSIAVVDVPLKGGAAVHEVRAVYTDSLTPSAEVRSLVASATSRVGPLVDRPIARIGEDMLRSGAQYPLGNLIADAMRVEGAGDVGIMNNGGIRANLRAGTATYGSLFEVMPFANVLYRVTVRGSELRRYLEQSIRRGSPNVHVSGARVTYDTTRAPGSRITAASVGGAPLAEAKSYRVVINDFMLGDSLGLAPKALRIEAVNLNDLDALIAYVRHLPSPVMAPKDERFVLQSAR
jgi:2',3'-cyclic-nucleotide 2'-phosphodiesterase / 3'-nucleotidase / 5'-nucleotidase